jgi:serine phosphatase RsbU (regulator of sigma subunit)/pSer/pThr/pTyr-binding forkhead associated (FHA) protein
LGVAYIKVLNGPHEGDLIPLEGETIVLGRNPGCSVVLPDAAVSRQHAAISEAHGSFFVEDLRSRNGTQVNEFEVTERHPLTDGDAVRVCEYEFSFHNSSSSSKLDPLKEDTTFLKARGQGSTVETAELPSAMEESADRSSIVSRIDARSGSGVRLSVKPEAKLRAILEIGKTLHRVLHIEEVLPSILDALFQIYDQADQGFVLLQEPDLEQPTLRAYKNRRKDEDSMSISKTIVARAMRTGEALLSNDASEDSRFDSSESLAGLRIRSMMCVPLVKPNEERVGVIQITTFDIRSKFTEDDLDLLVNVATQCTLAIDNAELHRESLHQQNMQRELEFAMQVQLGFLPNKRPTHSAYEFADYYEAAQHVGGDYFDYVMLPEGRLAVCIADVAGKGVPAALLSARLYSAARYHLLTNPDPAEAMNGLNSEISTTGLGHRFITCAIVVVDTINHEAHLVSAGHLLPIRRRLSGEVDEIDGEDLGLPLGIIPDQKFVAVTVPIERGDTWLLYTDGVNEARRSQNEWYETKRLIDFVETGPLEIGNLVRGIMEDVNSYVDGHAQSDDICMVGFQRNP